MAETRYWLFKSNVKIDTFESLLRSDNQTMAWVGVRNALARNLIRDEIRVGDGVLFYHSGIKNPAVAGTAQVVGRALPDLTAFEPKSRFYDIDSDRSDPKWLAVDIRAVQQFRRLVTLREIRENPNLKSMVLVRPGRGSSIQPVSREEWDEIVSLGMGG